MGLTAWVARYALPNARPTPACDWELPEAPPAEAPGERLHALLDEAREVPPSPRPAEPEPPRAARPPRPGMRSEERRVGKEGRRRRSRGHNTQKRQAITHC